MVGNEPFAHPALDGLTALGGLRSLEPDQLLRDVELPAHRHQRVALQQQRGVAEVGFLGGVVRALGVAERAQQAEPPAVHDVEEDHPVAARRIFRLEDEEVGGELHLSLLVPRRQGDVGDDLVARMRRVDGKVGLPQIFSYGPTSPNALPSSTSTRDVISTRVSSANPGAGSPVSISPTPTATAAMRLQDFIVHSPSSVRDDRNAAG